MLLDDILKDVQQMEGSIDPPPIMVLESHIHSDGILKGVEQMEGSFNPISKIILSQILTK